MTTTEPATPDIDKDPMWHQAYMDVAAVLDKALGTEEEDGAGAGIAADVWLLAHQRDEARAQVAQLAARLKDLTEPGLIPAAGPARVTTDWCIAWGGEDANDCAGGRGGAKGGGGRGGGGGGGEARKEARGKGGGAPPREGGAPPPGGDCARR